MIFLTGGTGFVGRGIAQRLSSQGKQVRCLVRRTSNLNVLTKAGVELGYGDVTEFSSLETALAGVDTIIHLAAVIREKKGATFKRINYEGTRNMVEAAKRAKVSRIIYMSNLGASSDQHFPFLYSKWLAEEEVRKSNIGYTIFRPPVIYGEDDQFINVLANTIRKTPVVPVIGSGKTKFQLIALEDVVSCITMALDDPRTIGQTIPLGGPQQLTYEEILDTIIQMIGLKRLKVHIPIPVMRPVVWIMERLFPRFPITSAQLAMLSQDNITDVDIVERLFGFSPARLRDRIGYIR